MNLNDLETFVAVAETGTFSAAGQQLGVPKSTVSRRVGRLEAALGTALLVRSARAFALSDDGRALYERCAPHLRDIADVAGDLADSTAEPQGTLRVTASIDLGTSAFLSDLLAAYSARYPRVRVALAVTNRKVDLLEEGVDMAFRTHARPLPPRDDLVARPLGPVTFGIFGSPGYIARCGAPTSVADVCDHRRLAHSTAGVSPWPGEPDLTADDYRPLAAMMTADAGLGVLPDFVAAPLVDDGRLVRVLPDWQLDPVPRLSLVWLRSRHLAPRVRAFIDLTAEQTRRAGWFR
ncbi:MAG: LysR family transcriptional regulator [Myxococcales bacterium]|nr:LysR family transcriptional regulator [Myxococcales bacterium]MCB9524248.1 LysR family transcriptional regulator [Myxococcales bacterium]